MFSWASPRRLQQKNVPKGHGTSWKALDLNENWVDIQFDKNLLVKKHFGPHFPIIEGQQISYILCHVSSNVYIVYMLKHK